MSIDNANSNKKILSKVFHIQYPKCFSFFAIATNFFPLKKQEKIEIAEKARKLLTA